MTRAEVLKDYLVIFPAGKIQTPGKFQGEMLYVPHFYQAFLDGTADSESGPCISFRVNDTDRQEFPELKGKRWVNLIQMDEGFIKERQG